MANTRKIQQISVLPPLQRDTAIVVPNSRILGGVEKTIDVVGSKLGALITVERISDAVRVYADVLRFECTEAKKFKVTNAEGAEIATGDATSANVVITTVQGLKITVASGLTGVVVGDIAEVHIIEDSTYIVPGTILGRVKDENSTYYGKWMPVGSDISKFDIFRVCGGTLETDKSRLVPASSDTMMVADNYTVDVYVVAEVIESVCKSINLTDDIKAKMQGIIWR